MRNMSYTEHTGMDARSTIRPAGVTGARTKGAILRAMAVIGGLALLLGASVSARHKKEFCTDTADLALHACFADARDDALIARANCINESERDERRTCRGDARTEREDAKEECEDQYDARLDVCDLIGEDRYDPDFEPADFVDPSDIGTTVEPNLYWPLVPGYRWVYEGGGETITVIVTDKTKLIDGVTCRVVNDVNREDDVVIEDTEDWYAQDREGNVWYFGELSRDFETFEGDDPEEGELVTIDGSFKAGRERAKPGILVLAAPRVGDVYRQEMSLGEAEDLAEVISVTGTESVPAASCTNDCLVTRDFTPLEPGVEENTTAART